MSKHFRQRCGHTGCFTWWQRRDNNEIIRSRCDYVLAEDPRDFISVNIVSPRYRGDHDAVVATMKAATPDTHREYLRRRKKFPLTVPRGQGNEADRLLKGLNRIQREAVEGDNRRPSWVSEETWRLVDQRATGRRTGALSGDSLRVLNSAIRRSLAADRKRRTETAAEQIQAAMGNRNFIGAWDVLKRWYHHSSGRPPKPSRMDMAELEQVYSSLYAADPPPGQPIPVHYNPVPIPDGPPTDHEVLIAVQRLRPGRAAGPSGLKIDDVKVWAKDRESNPEPWNKFLTLVKHCFATGEVPKATCFSTLVLIPKASGGVRGIGLLESVWNVISMIIKLRLDEGVAFDDALHGFRKNRGTGTAILEACLQIDYSIQQGQVLSQVFLDLSKAYDTLD
jgi:hypothetical protein